MTFSEFAKMMYPIIAKDLSPSDFILYLTNQIIEIPDMDMDYDDNEMLISNPHHPLFNLEENTLNKLFNGNRNLSKKRARIIISYLNKEKFKNCISRYPTDVINLIASDLRKNKIQFIDNKVIDVCTDLFVSILKDCANLTKKEKIVSYNLYDVIAKPGCYDLSIFNDLDRRGISSDYISQVHKQIQSNPSFYEYLKGINFNYICI